MLIEYHRNMLSDRPRLSAFHSALKQVVVPKKTLVADIGSGTGVLGFMASRLGAKKVYLYEQAEVMHLSQTLAELNSINNCEFLHGSSAEWRDPPKVDVVVSETLGNYAFEENIIATMNDAKRFLKPGGCIIPQAITQMAAPVVTDRFYKELMVWDEVGYGLDFSAAKRLSLNNIYVRRFKKSDLLGAQAWDSVDFRQKNSAHRRGRTEWIMESPATLYGFAVWWACELLPGITLSTAPDAPKTHWEQLYFPVLSPIVARKGDTLSLSISSTTTPEEGTNIAWTASLKSHKSVRQSLSLRQGCL